MPILLLCLAILAAAPAAQAAPADSLSHATVDSLPPAARVELAPWLDTPLRDARELQEIRGEGLDDILRDLPGAWLRLGGHRGGPAYLSLDPVGLAPELWVDGIPSANPADLQGGLWWRSGTSVGSVDQRDGELHFESRRSQVGRSALYSHFTHTGEATDLRGASFRTPPAPRRVEIDYEEWKSDEGLPFRLGVLESAQPVGLGRSKLRRFMARFAFDAGEEQGFIQFGRGRHLFEGSLNSAGTVDRWSGELSAGIDGEGPLGRWRMRLWHLDRNEDDQIHSAGRDGLRQGFRFERQGLWGFALLAERERAQFRWNGGANLSPARRSGRASFFLAPHGERFSSRVEVAARHASDLDRPWAPEAILEGQVEMVGSTHLFIGGADRRRAPSLLEIHGREFLDLPDGSTLELVGGGPLPFERQQSVYAGFARPQGRLQFRLAWEYWRLLEGVGFGIPNAQGQAEWRGGYGLERPQLNGQVQLRLGRTVGGMVLGLSAHRSLRDLQIAGSRGSGWPRQGLKARIRLTHSIRRDHNILFLDANYQVMGRHFDDAAGAPLGLAVVRSERLDLRAGISLRGAELYLALDNALDSVGEELYGWGRRPRELRWGLWWPILN